MTSLPACPFLPLSTADLDWRALNVYRGEDRGEHFYLVCLEYGHLLWRRGLAARALLCIDRGLGADLKGGEGVLRDWPLPYAATAWVLQHVPPGVFIGNPRVHFQHYAGRMNEPRREQRRWRAWACWGLTRAVRPDLAGDPKHEVEEPTAEIIAARLEEHGLPGEGKLWLGVLRGLDFSGDGD